jgi:UDP-3-O-[3-hydroxymyristoyl] glucosamine N-acyltransferase
MFAEHHTIIEIVGTVDRGLGQGGARIKLFLVSTNACSLSPQCGISFLMVQFLALKTYRLCKGLKMNKKLPGISQHAVIETKNLGSNVQINEFVIIRENVKIGHNAVIHPNVVINSGTVIDDNVEIFSGAVIGKNPQGIYPQTVEPTVDPFIIIGRNTSIGPHTIIHEGTNVGANSFIDGYCEIGYPSPLAEGQPLIIGKEALIRSHSVFYSGSTFGPGLNTGHRVTVREKTQAGKNLQIGTLSDIQGDCVIGNYVRFHSNVHIGKESKIGNFVWIYPYVVLTNDPTPPSDNLIGVTIGDFAVIATMSVILPGVVIGSRSLIGAHSLVTKNVPDGIVFFGVPAKDKGDASSIKLPDGSGRRSYPWMDRFFRGYPEEIVKTWKKS